MPSVGRLRPFKVMKYFLTILLILFILAGTTLAQRKATPGFQDYPVSEKFTGKPAPVNLRSHPHAREFRTMLRETAKLGAIFTGHYAVNYWGCGTECIRIGIVDLKTGRAYVSQFFANVGIATHIDSRLLIVAPPEKIKEIYGDDAPKYVYPRYYVWKNSRLVLVYPKSEKDEIFWK
jgi:hypothetical protein